jgi:hypothetical protein
MEFFILQRDGKTVLPLSEHVQIDLPARNLPIALPFKFNSEHALYLATLPPLLRDAARNVPVSVSVRPLSDLRDPERPLELQLSVHPFTGNVRLREYLRTLCGAASS